MATPDEPVPQTSGPAVSPSPQLSLRMLSKEAIEIGRHTIAFLAAIFSIWLRVGLGILVLLTIGLGSACNDSGFFPEASDFRFGSIAVRAFDQRNSPVAGATMELRDSRGNLVSADLNKTGGDGSVGFGPLHLGFYTITITPPAGYAIPASQSNPIGVDVRNTQTITINVFLFAE